MVRGKSVVARVDGGMLSSNNGVLLWPRRKSACGWLTVWRAASMIRAARIHSVTDMIGFRMKMVAAGYEDGNDAKRLRSDRIFKMAQDALPSGSGSGLPVDDVPAGEPARGAGNWGTFTR
ncbi:transposase [Mesorhizobium sp. M1227]|uniref:transposase n=1 Tax=Mesorhizobium sp. M1227 TaxID=2957071 RepID=UPI00333571A9